jgi:hypothetical protein
VRSLRAIRVIGAAVTLLAAGLVATTAQADPGVGTGTTTNNPVYHTVTTGSARCAVYANARGFGAWCGGWGNYKARTWRQRLNAVNGWPFIHCRNYPIPEGWSLKAPPEGKEWVWRAYIRDYDLDSYNGGTDAHLEYELVAVTPEEKDDCQVPDYMEQFWKTFAGTYPTPVLNIEPTYIPRVNSPAFFSLGMDITRNPPVPSDRTPVYNNLWNGRNYLAMQAVVTSMKIDPGDGTPPFTCQIVNEVYDNTKKPTEQTNTCKHAFKRSSASQPDGMYDVKVSAFWEVRMYIRDETIPTEGIWRPIGTFEVKSIQKLPVQEVQGIGGGGR